MTDQHRGEPFDEKTALAELEQLHAAIQAARQARHQKSEEFARFVQQFRRPPAIEREIAAPHTPEPIPQTPSPPREISPRTEASPPQRSVDAVSTVAGVAEPVPRSFQVSRKRRPLGIGLLGITVVIGAIAVGATFARSRRERAVPRATGPVVNSHASPAPVHTPSPTLPVAAPGVALELGTVRPVWIRVVVDGQKKMEATVPGGQRLQFAADRSIVVRVGNGGDVVVKTGELEKPFGEAGQPVTRTFVRAEDPHATHR